MFRSYFILNRLAVELNQKLKEYQIERAFSFEKEKLVLILTKDNEGLSLELSVNSGLPYIRLIKKSFIPRKNLVDFFTASLPAKIENVGISDKDRIVRFLFDKGAIYFTIRGKYTNIFLITDDIIESFKKADEIIKNNFREEITQTNFISNFNDIKIKNTHVEPVQLRKKYPFIGKEIVNEAKLRDKTNSERISSSILTDVINEIRNRKPAVFIDEDSKEVNLGVESLKIFSFTKKEMFADLSDAIDFFLIKKFIFGTISAKRKIIEKYLDRELQKTSNKLNHINLKIQEGSKEEEYSRVANTLLVNINKIKKGMNKIELEDFYNEGKSTIIKLDPKLSPQKNVNWYFEKAKNEKKSLTKSLQLAKETSKKFNALEKTKEKIEKAATIKDYNSIMKELKIKNETRKSQENDIKSKFRQYLLEKKYRVYVGKDSKSNDLLTLKFAKQNDYWFHARAVSGSHVVLKNDNPKEGMPKNILKLAASIAAYHSKAKTAGMVPVSYTQKKYVVKKKGMEAGKVALLKEEILIVKPEINEKCEYLND
jgi:predicted ribosome quality control (RQC) complex YloA/Tae2 family protein